MYISQISLDVHRFREHAEIPMNIRGDLYGYSEDFKASPMLTLARESSRQDSSHERARECVAPRDKRERTDIRTNDPGTYLEQMEREPFEHSSLISKGNFLPPRLLLLVSGGRRLYTRDRRTIGRTRAILWSNAQRPV